MRLVTCSWAEVPHLGAKEKAELLEGIPPYQREAREKGVPELGGGAVYPIAEDQVVVPDFPIPPHWPRAYGLDVGWNRTAAVWGALDRNTNVLYLYSEYYQGRATPETYAKVIRSRGAWIPGVIDPASSGSSQHDGTRIIDLLVKEKLILTFADNDVEAGIYDVWQRLQKGTLKVFNSLANWRQEYRLYRRDPNKDGKIHKPRLPPDLAEGQSAAQYGDHLQDATRYLIRSGLAVMKPEPPKRSAEEIAGLDPNWQPPSGPLSWMR